VNYQETVEYLFSLLPVFQNEGKSALNYKLDKTLQLLEILGNPHHSFKAIHVAGTNGKGTTSHLLAAVLHESGYKVGLYTSPHLKSFTERIKVDRNVIPEDAVVSFVEKYDAVLKDLKPSFFEMSVVMAFDYFRSQKIDIAVVEVGLGGRFDSTNVLKPILSVITNISLDHQEFLGDTIEDIAKEKAGIIKLGVPVVIGEYHKSSLPVFQKVAREQGAQLIEAFQVELPIELINEIDANYILINKRTAYAVIVMLELLGYKISKEKLVSTFDCFMVLWELKGRWQLLGTKPDIYCDTGHNEAGVKLLVSRLKMYSEKKIHVVWGMAADKDVSEILELLPQDAQYYFCQANIPRAMDADKLHKIGQQVGLVGVVEKSVNSAIELVKKSASKDDLIIIGGSTFVVAEIKDL
jgi:dihydrofolate synthase/folylpolyglutamate synthase